jgi:MFS family permease
MDLYCTRQYQRSIIQSSLSIGSLLGLIIMNIVGDLKGRKYALLVDLILAVLSSLCNMVNMLVSYVGAIYEYVPLLVLASIMSGFSGYSLTIISYIIIGDIC